MRLLYIFELIFRCLLIILAIYHVFRRQSKIVKAPALVLVLSFVPSVLTALFDMNIDTISIFLYDIILFMALYLGSSLRFYDKYWWWDRTLHLLSGIAGAGFGIALINLQPGIYKWIILSFGFTFSVTLHVFWEVLEYAVDYFFHENAQRWQKVHDSKNHVPEKAVQPAGLVDTMNDIICCLIGAVLAVIVWWVI